MYHMLYCCSTWHCFPQHIAVATLESFVFLLMDPRYKLIKDEENPQLNDSPEHVRKLANLNDPFLDD